MPKINVLSKEVSELIAAGEVIERPASIVKELLENSIDSGAAAVTVEIKDGGVASIRVTDDGCGMEKEDLALAFLRHATSKVQKTDDLERIATLGFRGEALASIAAVSRLNASTKPRGQQFGYKIEIEGGDQLDFDEVGCPDGTTIIVNDLFYNVPARLKFLKKASSEANSVGSILEKLALSHPEISFKFISDGKLKLHTPGNSDLKAAVYAVFGKDFTANLLPVSYESGGVRISGFVCKPSGGRSNRGMQNFFVNNRYVRSKTCIAALEEGYKNSIMVGKFPTCVLNVEIPFSEVDVNVHPAKIEVRFTNERAVFDAVYFGVKTALLNDDIFKETMKTEPKTINTPVYENEQAEQLGISKTGDLSAVKQNDITAKINPYATAKIGKTPINSTSVSYKRAAAEKESEIKEDKPISSKFSYITAEHIKPSESGIRLHLESGEVINAQTGSDGEPPEAEKTAANSPQKTNILENVKVIGEVFSTYLIFELNDTVLFMDKHAAHERILFEKLKKSVATGDGQTLISENVVSLSAEEFQAVIDNADKLSELGFAVEEFGNHSVIIREAPMAVKRELIADALLEIAQKLMDNKKNPTSDIFENLLHSIACRCAIKANDKTDIAELTELLRQVYENDEVRYCPHGRPIVVAMTRHEFEKKFGRA